MGFDPVGVVLAAGRGERMGGPKVLLMGPSEPLVLRHVRCLREAGCERVVVVVPRHLRTRVRALMPSADADHVRVLGVDTKSPAESLRAAYAGLGEPTSGAWLVTHVDRLPVMPATCRALLKCSGMEVDVVTPVYEGHSGHPIVMQARCLRMPFESLRELVRAPAFQRYRLDVQDRAVLINLNDPETYRRAFAAPPRFAPHNNRG